MALSLSLPWAPTTNTYYRADSVYSVKQKRYVPTMKISKKGRQYLKAVEAAVVDTLGGVPAPMSGPVQVVLDLYPPDRRRRDIDNYCKALFDALTHAQIWEDDSQIVQLQIYKHDPQNPGSITVTVEEL